MSDSLGHRIRIARKAAGLSQDDVARLGGPARPTLSRIERGGVLEPEQFTIESLIKVLNVRPEWLVLGKGPMKEEGARETTIPYSIDSIDAPLLGECCEAILEALERHQGPRPPASKLGAAIAEIYLICQRDGRKPTDELVASFVRVLLA